MLLGNRKKQAEERNWCVVLHRLQNEIDKKKVASKISEVFGLSLDEAFDLTSNTPIILLDNLNEDIASKIKDYFSVLGAEMKMTNDIFVKRKCYRTVWPEMPNLSFLHDLEDAHYGETDNFNETVSESGDYDNADPQLVKELEKWQKECHERRQEITLLKKEIALYENQKSTSLEVNEDDDAESLRLKVENKELQKKLLEQVNFVKNFEAQKANLEKNWQEKYKVIQERYENQVEENKNRQNEYEKSFENFHLLQNQKRALEEELLDLKERINQGSDDVALRLKQVEDHLVAQEKNNVQLIKESEAEKRKNLELLQRLEKLQFLKNELSEQIHNQQLTAEDEMNKIQKRLEVAIETLEAQKEKNEQFRIDAEKQRESVSLHQLRMEKFQEESAKKDVVIAKLQSDLKEANEKSLAKYDAIQGMEERLHGFEAENQELLKKLNQMKQIETLWKEKHDSVSRKLDGYVAKQSEYEQKMRTIDAAKTQMQSHLNASEHQNSQLESKVLMLEKVIQEISIEKTTLLQDVREQSDQLEQKTFELDQVNQQLDSMKTEINKQSLRAAEELKEKEADALKLKQALFQKEEVLSQTIEQCRQFEVKFLDLKSKLDASVTFIKEKEQALESKEAELDALKKQLKGLSSQFEQRESVLKRDYLSEKIKQKESELKELVVVQNEIESEIHQREDKMRLVLARQEKIEKEIVGAKQSQRHLNEQSSKENSGSEKLKKSEPYSKDNSPHS